MFLTFERLSTRKGAGRHESSGALAASDGRICETGIKRSPSFECRCGVQVWDRALEENSK